MVSPSVASKAPASPDTATVKRCDRNLGEILKAIVSYKAANNDKWPRSLADVVPKYLSDPKVLICPADKTPMTIKNGLPCSYRYIGNAPWSDIKTPWFILYDHAAHDGGRNFVFFDGHTHHLYEQDFQKVLAGLYEQLKPLMAKPDFPGDRDRVKAFCEDKDFPEEAAPPAAPAAPAKPSPDAILQQRFHFFSLPGVPLKKAVEILDAQLDKNVKFVIDPKVVNDVHHIKIDLQEVTLAEVLDAMLAPYGFQYAIVEDGIYIGESSLRQYDVADLLPLMDGTKILKTLIVRTGLENWDGMSVSADGKRTSWDWSGWSGGSGRMIYLHQQWLMVNHVNAIHDMIATRLAGATSWTAARAGQARG
jgi:prepilin-type processing-associated H-X9-DG protein